MLNKNSCHLQAAKPFTVTFKDGRHGPIGVSVRQVLALEFRKDIETVTLLLPVLLGHINKKYAQQLSMVCVITFYILQILV